MNKQELDQLFEQARAELKANMPIDQVQGLIQKPQTTSFWKAKKNWIMGSTIISVVSLSTLLLLNLNFSGLKTELKDIKSDKSELKQHDVQPLDKTPSNLKKEFAINYSNLEPPSKVDTEKGKQIENKDNNNDQAPAVKSIDQDSLIPKETFREYTVSIKNNSSMKEIKELEKELSSYGIHMHIEELAYADNNKISSFKGHFDTDELFCGTAIKKHEFDFGNSFQEVQFTFRVAKSAQKLKYFSIQSDDMKNDIECYDDEVISDAAEAREIQEKVAREMTLSKAEMKRAMAEMQRAMEELAKHKEEIKRSIEEEFKNQMDLEKLINEEVELSLKQSLKAMEKELAKVDTLKGLNTEELKKQLRAIKSDIQIELKDAFSEQDKEEMKRELKEAMREMKEGLQEAELEMKKEMREMEKERQLMLKEKLEKKDRSEATPEELENQAKALKQQAKELKKKAKLKKKEARQKKNKKEKK